MARSTASIMWGGVRKPKAMGSPMFRYLTVRPDASTLRASATMFRMAYTKPLMRGATGMTDAVRKPMPDSIVSGSKLVLLEGFPREEGGSRKVCRYDRG